MDSTKLASTVHSMATQTPPELLRVHARNTTTPVASQASQTCMSSPVRSVKYMSGRAANPAVSHSNTKMSANGFHWCVTNSPSSSHG